MNSHAARLWMRVGLVAALAAGCTEPKYDPRSGQEDDDEVEDASARSDARSPARRPDAEADRAEPDRAPRDPEVTRTERDAEAAPRDAHAAPRDGGDAGASPPVDEADAGPVVVVSEPAPDGACILTGTYAVRAEFDVSWEGRTIAGLYPLVRAGTGKSVVYARIDVDGSFAAMASRVAICGTEFPDFIAGDATFITERYGFYIPDDVWERESMPRWDVLWQRECDVARPGCALRGLELDATLGTMAFAEAPGMITPFDHDGDGHPGVTVRVRTPEESAMKYQRVPLSFSTNARAESLFSALLVGAQFNAVLRDCDSFTGDLGQPRIAIRAVGCLMRPELGADEVPCTSEHARFLGDNVPTVTAQAATFEGRRIRAGVDCAAVRSVFAEE